MRCGFALILAALGTVAQPGGYQGVLTSNQFGQPTSVNTGFGGGGFGSGGFGNGSVANNRRIDFSIRFNF
jgi:hypothetical protein